MKEKLTIIVGPTAVGKTALSIEIAKKFQGEVISGDSMQIYKGLDIGTAKVTDEEKEGINHYMIDILDPSASFSVADFQKQVQENIETIYAKDKRAIIAGGTGLYIQSVLYNYQFAENERSSLYEKQIEAEINQKGIDSVYQRLQRIDPVQAEKVHPNNRRRLIRALEVYDRTGITMTEHQQNQVKEALYDVRIIGLEMERALLYDRINERVDQMVEDGLIEEVKHFYEKGLENCQSMRGIGYKEIIPYLKGDVSLDEAIDILKRNSRRFAKRQYTWFKNKMPVEWYPITVETKDQVFQNILADLEGFYKET
ncbi:tRNA (adenosine(37)-N6)-dimethylallyltransferase MiaA [Gracilibacillus sp. S3-1-1]|uniref:tRNA (Adenosine(37)-N6)-dimethylallyltransferase MiaA n=1 Tax=Gracilibacillus pellucidus TaxID=3095368 RepID=A0ACC6M848_9BACI|nr:tRNA (adenosine(37)-N6)-dimethylallyltransferase MiaA [Gracilibacillus sp. S3-1-1]MDX8047017.1 tRNA (adenosine(37)-N6)-dimethylallyltransferase MiaA [Gracilibacillus sp. S3-1-1]